MGDSAEKTKTILIIGDWFIDENWLVSKHNSANSSHTGEFHYLSKHDDVGKRMTSLCGVPEILEMIKYHLDNYTIISYGAWNLFDNNVLKCTLCDEGKDNLSKNLTVYKLKGLSEIEKENKCPYTKTNCKYNYNIKNLSKSNNSSTNRIIRVYEGHSGSKPNLLYRFDWELELNKDDIDYNQIISDIKENDVQAIIIEDHNKGVITPELITKIVEILSMQKKEVKWYIRSKVDNPIWLDLLFKKFKIRLRVIDNKIAQKKGQRRWTYGKELGRASLELLGELSGDFTFRDCRPIDKDGNLLSDYNLERLNYGHTEKVAVLMDDNIVIAKNNEYCFNLNKALGPKQLINVGRTTTFFSALILQDLLYNGEDFGIHCRRALNCAYEWSKQASIEWNKSNYHFYGNYATALDSAIKSENEAPGNKEIVSTQSAGTESTKTKLLNEGDSNKEDENNQCKYLDSWEKWNSSSQNLGIIKNNNKEYIQTWRGESTLERYICTGGPKRSEIDDLISNISRYIEDRNPKHPYNCLLIADPGWGKSFLAKSLAKKFDLQFMEFSLSQMASTEDLVDSFDYICSYQNQNDKKVLVFIDEVNCEIEGSPVLGLFLNPIWDGNFVRNGKTYKLSPAVWIFASTGSIDDIRRVNKGDDFISRLNGPIVRLDNHYEDDSGIPEYILTEQVYIGISMLNRYFGPISAIEESVLSILHNLVPINGMRSFEFFISRFRNIQRGRVLLSNMPNINDFPELKRHIKLNKTNNKSNKLIDIKTQME